MKYQYYLDLLDLKDDDNLNEEIIKKHYKKFALKFHPDKGGCAEDFHEIQEAYETLSNEEKRGIYDATGMSSNE